MENTLTFLDIAGYFATIIVFVRLGVAIWNWFTGISPAVRRLGKGLAKRKIALFSSDHGLKHLLEDSGLFREENIIEISKKDELGRCEDATIFLVYWPEWSRQIKQIIAKKTDKTALIVYAPRSKGEISKKNINLICEERNSSITNFRGRLLNDLVSAMITTGYQ